MRALVHGTGAVPPDPPPGAADHRVPRSLAIEHGLDLATSGRVDLGPLAAARLGPSAGRNTLAAPAVQVQRGAVKVALDPNR